MQRFFFCEYPFHIQFPFLDAFFRSLSLKPPLRPIYIYLLRGPNETSEFCCWTTRRLKCTFPTIRHPRSVMPPPRLRSLSSTSSALHPPASISPSLETPPQHPVFTLSSISINSHGKSPSLLLPPRRSCHSPAAASQLES